jgi:phosphoribosyl 1,2-cyclic phosphodiesterase
MNNGFSVTFWGVRGSYPVPGKSTQLFGGNTTCIEVRAGKATLIIDAGTGIIKLGNKIASEYFEKNSKTPLQLTILFTHLHHDHTQGFPFFTPLYLGQSSLYIYGPRNFGEELQLVLERSMTPPNFPIDLFHSNSIKEISNVKENNIILLDEDEQKPEVLNKFFDKIKIEESTISIKILNDYSHPADGVYVYRIDYRGKSVVFATDVEGYIFGNSRLINFSKGADLLIHDAQYTKDQYVNLPTPKQGFGHSIPEMAIEVAKKAEVRSLAITHHDPLADDVQLKRIEKSLQRRFSWLFYAREGLTFTIK